MSNKILGYFMRVDEKTGQVYQGYFGEIENTLKEKQRYVGYNQPGNLIQVIGLDRNVDVVFNEEGKLKGLPANRAILDDEGNVLDIIVGNIICLRHNDEGDFVSIKETDRDIIEKYLRPVREYMEKILIVESAEKLDKYVEK